MSEMIEPGRVYQLSPLVRRITAPNGGRMTGPGTNTYLVGRDELAIIDPGPLIDSHVDAILAAAGETPVRWVMVTHTHPDHSPAVQPLLDATGATAVGCVLEDNDGHQDVTFSVERNLQHGERFETSEFALEAIFTPGHIGNHFAFLLHGEGMLFAGDHVMEGVSVVIIPPSGDLGDYIDSLQRLRDYPITHLAPAHGRLIADPEAEIEQLIAHRLYRENKVVAALADAGEVSLDDLVSRVYTDVDAALFRVARYSLWAHLIKLEKEGRARKTIREHWALGEELWALAGDHRE